MDALATIGFMVALGLTLTIIRALLGFLVGEESALWFVGIAYGALLVLWCQWIGWLGTPRRRKPR